MTVSFGIEFESDMIDDFGNIVSARQYVHEFVQGLRPSGGWGVQDDPSAGVEIRSPIFTSVENAAARIGRFFSSLFDCLESYSFFSYNRPGRSIGQHIHIGKPRGGLLRLDKRKIANAIALVYPFLAAIHANPLPSVRGLRSLYCYSIHQVDFNIPHPDHYCEISASGHGTVEFRIFDSNIPQASLTCAWIMQKIAEKSLRAEPSQIPEIDRERYVRDRAEALTHGPVALNILSYLRTIRGIIGNQDLPRLDSVKEILYLACKYGLTPYAIYHAIRPKPFYYFRTMFSKPDRFIENLLEISEHVEDRGMLERLERIRGEASLISNFDELIGIALASLESLRQMAGISAERDDSRGAPAMRGIPRSVVRQLIASGAYRICRITEVCGLNHHQVADRISYLLRHHGDGLVRVLSPDEVISCSPRFYVFTVRSEVSGEPHILGAIAVNVRTGEICHLVVDRRYRRLGIARLLVNRVLEVLRLSSGVRPFCYIRSANGASIELFKSMGFRVVRKNSECLKLEYSSMGV